MHYEITENWHCPQCNSVIIKEECYEELMADSSMSKDGFLEINEMWVYD